MPRGWGPLLARKWDPIYLAFAPKRHLEKLSKWKNILQVGSLMDHTIRDMEKQLRDAYFSGLIDGEGCIGLYAGGGRDKHARECIQVKMACETTIKALHEHFGVGHVIFQKRLRPHWKDQWRWRVSCKMARVVAEIVRPYLITKKADMDRVFPIGSTDPNLPVRDRKRLYPLRVRVGKPGMPKGLARDRILAKMRE
jgi:hypothetical protein